MDYEQGMNYLIGQVMKITKGKADPVLARKIFEEFVTGCSEAETRSLGVGEVAGAIPASPMCA
jgi:hypothetical protein